MQGRAPGLAMASVLLAACTATPPATGRGAGRSQPPQPERGTVERVVDGDTLRVTVHGESRRVRLIGVDAPETHEPMECWADESTKRLAELTAPGEVVRLTPDQEPVDRYGRDLRYLVNNDGVQVNETLVAEGAAVAIKVEPNTARWDGLRGAQRAARTARRGGWGACPSDAPPWSGDG